MSYTPPEATYYAACDPSINRRSPSWSEVSNLYFPKSRDVCQEHLASWMCLKARTPSWKKNADFKLIKRSPQSMATASITSPTSVTSTSTATVAPTPTTYDCCVACITDPNCSASLDADGLCELFYPSTTCTGPNTFAGYYYGGETQDVPAGQGFVVSDGNCGQATADGTD